MTSGAANVEAWLPGLYDCLRDLAERALGREAGPRTLQPTALVHEAWLRMAETRPDVREPGHFLGLAARVLRQVLVDDARRRRAAKRGGGWGRVTLHADVAVGEVARPLEVLALDEALTALEVEHARAARVVELRYFSGLSIDETAACLGVSATTVDVDWRFARAWLSRVLDDA